MLIFNKFYEYCMQTTIPLTLLSTHVVHYLFPSLSPRTLLAQPRHGSHALFNSFLPTSKFILRQVVLDLCLCNLLLRGVAVFAVAFARTLPADATGAARLIGMWLGPAALQLTRCCGQRRPLRLLYEASQQPHQPQQPPPPPPQQPQQHQTTDRWLLRRDR